VRARLAKNTGNVPTAFLTPDYTGADMVALLLMAARGCLGRVPELGAIALFVLVGLLKEKTR